MYDFHYVCMIYEKSPIFLDVVKLPEKIGITGG